MKSFKFLFFSGLLVVFCSFDIRAFCFKLLNQFIMKTKLYYIVFVLLFCTTIYCQKGFRVEVGLGPPLGETREFYSVDIQGKFYYLSNVTDQFDMGVTTGFSIFLGSGASDGWFSDIPSGIIPLAVAGRMAVSKTVSIGADVGYGIGILAEDSGFYFSPVFAYNKNRNLAFTASYSNIYSSGFKFSSLLFGVNFGFLKLK